jgi:hypothetical protein
MGQRVGLGSKLKPLGVGAAKASPKWAIELPGSIEVERRLLTAGGRALDGLGGREPYQT